jgi:acyl-CoA dehydrogenase
MKAEILPRILSGETWWAQGYSEPGAGSDLAAVGLSAVSDGDDYVLNGSKIWTTKAHESTHIFLLVRTARGEKKQYGLTFLLADLATPGIEVRPVINIAGDHDYNQVFFTDARVPKSQRLGPENEGWTVARHLLVFENAVAGNGASELLRRLGWLQNLAQSQPDGCGGVMADDPAVARDIARLAAEVQRALFAAEWSARQRQRGDVYRGPALLGMRFRESAQRMTEVAMEAVGPDGAAIRPEAFEVIGEAETGAHLGATATPFYLSQRALTIAGGTPEIYRNNLGRSLLKS